MKNGLTQLVCAGRFFVLLFLLFTPFTLKAQEAGDTVRQVYIPKDLPDCVRVLDSMLSPEDKAYIREKGAAAVHFSLGMWLRNNWGLWGDSRLQTYFANNGIHHPDDMSGVILDCYVLHLQGENVNYRRILRTARREEKKWRRVLMRRYKEEQKMWDYADRYDCDFDDSTATFETATAFLNLPITVDPGVGTQICKREEGEPEEVELRLIEKILQREPIFTPQPDALVRSSLDIYYGRQPKGRVKSMVMEEVDGLHCHEFHFNPDGTLAEVKGRSQKGDTLLVYTWREEYIYQDGQLVMVSCYNDDTLKKETRYVYLPGHHLQTYTYTPASPQVATDSNSLIISPEGKMLVDYRKDGSVFRINEYDTLGRMVTTMWYRDGCLWEWWSNVYDDAQHLYYEIHRNVFEHIVTCYVLNGHGDLLGECCADKLNTYNRKKTYYTYRYDRHGNWTRRYEMGRLATRCKITYYK